MKKTMVLIPGRGGSKGIKNKNYKLLNGKPLIEYTLDFALKFFPKENIFLSTDSARIINICSKKIDIHFKRPKSISLDKTPMNDVISHAVNFVRKNNLLKFDKLLLLQPTSPIRNNEDIMKLYKRFNNDIEMVLSVQESKISPNYNLFYEDKNGFLKKFSDKKITRRQDAEKYFFANGSMYLIRISDKKIDLGKINKIKKIIMNRIYSIDIDNEDDWLIAEQILRR